jgi:hypothetical protein
MWETLESINTTTNIKPGCAQQFIVHENITRVAQVGLEDRVKTHM